MSLWDGAENFFSGGGKSDVDNGYNEANSYFQPYQKGGLANFNQMQDYAGKWGNDLHQFDHAGDWQYNHINESPNEYYDSIMGGYSESPEAKYAQQKAFDASSRGASASGMVGSGAFMKGLQENANQISQGDRQQYYNNVIGSNNAQMGALQNLQGQQGNYRQMMQYLTSLGYGAGTNMANNSVNQGTADAQFGRQTIGDLMSMAGFGGGGGLFGNGNNGQGYGRNSGIPPYAMKAIMAGAGG